MFEWNFNNIFQIIISPPNASLLLLGLAWLLKEKLKVAAIPLALIAIGWLIWWGNPTLFKSVERQENSFPVYTHEQIKDFKQNKTENSKIIVYSAGRKKAAPEYDYTDTVNAKTLELLRYAAYLHKKTDIPIMVVGGESENSSISEAVLMNQVLTDDFGVEVKWVEENLELNESSVKRAIQFSSN